MPRCSLIDRFEALGSLPILACSPSVRPRLYSICRATKLVSGGSRKNHPTLFALGSLPDYISCARAFSRLQPPLPHMPLQHRDNHRPEARFSPIFRVLYSTPIRSAPQCRAEIQIRCFCNQSPVRAF